MDENKKSFWKTCMFGYIPAGYFTVMLVGDCGTDIWGESAWIPGWIYSLLRIWITVG